MFRRPPQRTSTGENPRSFPRRALAVALAGVVLGTGVLVSCGSSTPGATSVESQIDELVEEFLHDTELTGLRMVVTAPDRDPVHVEAGELPPNRFQLYSVTKAFVAAVVFRLADRGLVDVDAPIGRLESLSEPDAFEDVTLGQLLEHRVRLEDYRDHLSDDEVLSDVELVDRVVAAAPPERAYEAEYSTTGYMVVGLVLTERTGTPWDELLEEELLDPLGLDETRVVDARTSRSRHAAGAVVSTVGDVGVFLDELLRHQSLVSRRHLARMWPDPDETFGAGLWQMCPCSLDGTVHLAVGHPGEDAAFYWMGESGIGVVIELGGPLRQPESRAERVDALVADIGIALG